jgi:hypothetical protein
MTDLRITSGQMKRLQTLYGQLCAHTQQSSDRAARIAWASQLLGRAENERLASFSDLTQSDARHLIDALQAQLGVQHPTKKRQRREAADRHGRDGRGDGQDLAATPEMVSAADLETIESYYQRLGWTRDRFDAWLRSPHSPLKKSSPVIATKAHANRVRWALKGMLQHAGLWEERPRREVCA